MGVFCLLLALVPLSGWAGGGLPLAPPPTNRPPPDAVTNEISEALLNSQERLVTTNLLPGHPPPSERDRSAEWREKLELARHQRLTRQTKEAVPNLVAVLASDAPEPLKRTALIELALAAQDEHDLVKAQQILAQYLARWPDDPSVPEILLRQGLILRDLGLNTSALTKFYAVMTSALVLKNDQASYYQRLVLQAQTEIAETHYRAGQNTEAVDFLGRLLKQDSPGLNKAQIEFKLVRSLAALDRQDEVVARANDFLGHFPDAAEEPEVRFFLATALKQLGRSGDALQQVLRLLQEQQAQAQQHPALWAYWQRRTGNEIANQLYREGDYARALEVYLSLAQLDPSPAWQLPVWYQAGVAYEHLEQPAKAIETYDRILRGEPQLGTNAAPGLKAVVDMARWRRDFLNWQSRAELTTSALKQTAAVKSPAAGLAKATTP